MSQDVWEHDLNEESRECDRCGSVFRFRDLAFVDVIEGPDYLLCHDCLRGLLKWLEPLTEKEEGAG